MEHAHILVLNGGPKTVNAMKNGCKLPMAYIKTRSCVLKLDQKVTLLHKGTEVKNLATAIAFNRYAKHEHFCGIVLEHINAIGGTVVQKGTLSYRNSAEKSSQLPRFVRNGLAIPRSYVGEPEGIIEHLDDIIENLPLPLILKADGECGMQVFLCHDKQQILTALKSFPNREAVTLQEYINNQGDIRIVICFEEFLGAIHRSAGSESFLNNVAQGGSVTTYEASEAERVLAQKALRCNKIDFGGVDIVYAEDNTPLLLEVNYGLGVKGFESVHKDQLIFGQVARHIETLYK
jgi:RimK family alpha-L-glutamate ligase